MTEYDHSPEAYQRYIETQQRITKWVDHAETKRAQFTNPFVTSPRSDLDEEEMRNDFHTQAKQQGHHHHHHHPDRSHKKPSPAPSSPSLSNQFSAKLVPQSVAHAFYPSSQWYLTPSIYASGATTPPVPSALAVSGNSNSSLSLASPRPNKLRKGKHPSSTHPYKGYTSQPSNATAPATVIISPPTVPVIPPIPAPAPRKPVYSSPYASQSLYHQPHAPAHNSCPVTTPGVVPAIYPAAIQHLYQAKSSIATTRMYVPSTTTPYSILIPQASR